MDRFTGLHVDPTELLFAHRGYNMLLHIPDEASNFMTYDYAELKDLCKQFLTLVSGILVFSVTFAEKIVGYKATARWPLLGSWISFIIAIVLCGAGLGMIALAGGQAVSGAPSEIYRHMESIASLLAFGAGLSFVLGLACLIVAGVWTMFMKTDLTKPPSETICD